jgi:hypothetical protein
MKIIRDVAQGSAEWLALRRGLVTCSELDCLLVNGKGPEGFGAGAMSYMDQLIGERITGEAAELPFQTKATERGHKLEGMARGLYQVREGVKVEEVAIILSHGIGYSPDGLIGDAGLTEIKTKLPKFQVGVLLAGEVPKEHVAQCQGGLYVSGREWIDFVSYWPGMPLFVKRMYRDDVYIANLAERVTIFNELLENRMAKVLAA